MFGRQKGRQKLKPGVFKLTPGKGLRMVGPTGFEIETPAEIARKSENKREESPAF